MYFPRKWYCRQGNRADMGASVRPGRRNYEEAGRVVDRCVKFDVITDFQVAYGQRLAGALHEAWYVPDQVAGMWGLEALNCCSLNH